MTPSSTDRSHSISPLDVFAAMPHLSALGVEPSPAFETVLNKVPAPAKARLPRQPMERVVDAQPTRDTEADEGYAAERYCVTDGHKKSSDVGPTDRAQHKDDDHETEDEPAEAQLGGPAATGSPPVSQQPQDSTDSQAAVGEEVAQTVDPTSDQALVNGPAAKQLRMPLIHQHVDPATDPTDSPDSSQPLPNVAANSSSEKILGADKPAIDLDQPEASGDATLSTQDYAASVHGNGPPSLAEPGQSSNAADPIVAIDEQTAAAVEIQPVEPSGNSVEQESRNSKGEDSSPQGAEDPQQQVTPSPDHLTKTETQTAALAPLTISDAQTILQETAAPQSGTSQQTTGVSSSQGRLPQQVLTRTEAPRGHNPPSVPVDSARFLSRVAKAFHSAQQREGNEVRLRLSPPELGSLRLQVSVQDGVMVARMETETEAARSTLVNNLPALRERLAEQGVRIERFDIDLMQRPPTGTPDRPSDPQQQHEPQPPRAVRRQPTNPGAPVPNPQSHNWNGQGRLNVII